MAEQPEHPVELTVEQVRERVLGVLAEEVAADARRGRRRGADGHRPGHDHRRRASSSGTAGSCPLLDREGVSERVIGRRFLPPGVASVPA